MKLKFVNGSSLIETVIALLILIIISGIAMSFIDAALNSDNTEIKLQALLKIEELNKQTKLDKDFFDQQWNFKNLLIERRMISIPQFTSAYILDFITYQKDKKIIAESKEIVYLK